MSVLKLQSEKIEVQDATGLYNGYQVEYLGDKAGVRLFLKTAKHTTSATHLKDRTIPFNVVTTSEPYYLDALNTRIKGANPEDLSLLLSAKHDLEKFIKLNGMTNPSSSKDWEGVDVYVTPTHAPQMA